MRALVTGAARGLGFETARALAAGGASVLLVDRDASGGAAALARLRTEHPRAEAAFSPLNLADLGAVRRFAGDLAAGGAALDLLVNNAGILPPLQRHASADGFELTFAIAQLGHFALTGLLLPCLLRAPAPRVVGVTSLVYVRGRIDFDDLQAQRRYEPMVAYMQSKLAVLMFALELHRRAGGAGIALRSLAAHPGVARTGIGEARLREPPRRLRDRLEMWAFRAAMAWVGQSAADGARPIVEAATSPAAQGGELYGPGGFREWSGAPRRLAPAAVALEASVRARLWEMSEELTGVRWL